MIALLGGGDDDQRSASWGAGRFLVEQLLGFAFVLVMGIGVSPQIRVGLIIFPDTKFNSQGSTETNWLPDSPVDRASLREQYSWLDRDRSL